MISLQTFEIQDIPRLIGWIPDAKFLLQWAGPNYRFPLDEKQVMESYKASQAILPVHYIFKVVLESEQRIIGHLELLGVDHEKRTAVLGRLLIAEPSDRGKGYGETMIRLGLKFGFEDLELNEIDLGVFAFNKPAINCYKKLGFQEYKSLRCETDIGDEFRSLKRMRLLRDNWQNV